MNIEDKSMQIARASMYEFFQALSDPYRIRIVGLMLRTKSEVCLCELAESLGEPEYKLSRHIKVLKNVGLVSSIRYGKWIYHSLVSADKHQRAVHEAIRFFPGHKSEFENDFARFKRRAMFRDGGRCRQPSAGRSAKKEFTGKAQ